MLDLRDHLSAACLSQTETPFIHQVRLLTAPSSTALKTFGDEVNVLGFGPYSYLSAVPQFFFDLQIVITFAFLASRKFTAVKQCIFLLGISILEKGWK